MEYLNDYSSPETRRKGEEQVQTELMKIGDEKMREKVRDRLNRIQKSNDRDFYF
jgi:2-iminoacetate synthase